MKKIFLLVILVSLLGCRKKNGTSKSLNQNYDTENATLLFRANFVSNSHPTTGCVSVYELNGTKSLVFEGFKTDSGPDLKVYLSKSTSNSNIVDLGALKSLSGNFNYTLDNSVNLGEYKHVLIWCEDFSVLFGNGVLQ